MVLPPSIHWNFNFSLREEAIFRWCPPTSLYWSHHLQMFPKRFPVCNVKYFTNLSVAWKQPSTINTDGFFFFFFLHQRTCSCVSVREKRPTLVFLFNFYKTLFSCTQGRLVYLLSHYLGGFRQSLITDLKYTFPCQRSLLFWALHANFMAALHMNGWVWNDRPFEMRELNTQRYHTMFGSSLGSFIYRTPHNNLHLKLSLVEKRVSDIVLT